MSTKVAPSRQGEEDNELPLTTPKETKEKDRSLPSSIRENVRLQPTKLEIPTTDSRSIVNVSTYVDSIWPKYDLDKDGQLNPKELKNLFKVLSQRPITEENAALFLKSVDADGNNLIDKSEMVAFINKGVAMSKPT